MTNKTLGAYVTVKLYVSDYMSEEEYSELGEEGFKSALKEFLDDEYFYNMCETDTFEILDIEKVVEEDSEDF